MLNPKEMEVLILGGDLNDNADSTSVSNLSAILGRKGGVQVAWASPPIFEVDAWTTSS
jgi:hypothetical protein